MVAQPLRANVVPPSEISWLAMSEMVISKASAVSTTVTSAVAGQLAAPSRADTTLAAVLPERVSDAMVALTPFTTKADVEPLPGHA